MNALKWIAVVVASVTLGAASAVGISSLKDEGGDATTIFRSTPSSSSAVADNITDVSDLYAKVRDSVVEINASNTRQGTQGLGSGVVLDKTGRILTNYHVVNGFDSIDVQLSDGTAVSAQVVGTDPGNDLAVIKADIPADKLKPVTLGDSTKVEVGAFVIAVGNPFGIQGTVTQGIVSGIDRTLAGGAGRPLRQLIQSDAAINPGNSGGGLFDASGKLIGITTAIENPSGDRVFVGIGYAVPSATIQRFLPEMLAGATVQHPRLGIGLENLTPAVAQSLNLSVSQGVLVTSVDAASGAARAGLRGGTGGRAGTGDVIVSIDGKDVKTYNDLAGYLDTKKVGDKVTLKVVRDGKDMNVEITLDPWVES